jgi:AcrR family transcriptional regulator/predicted GNAT family acetyltransferase
MTSPERREYRSEVREGHARATRRAIVQAAADLFVERGYSATTIDAVAERAGVGRKTVFSSVGGKGALLKLAWDWALVGDDEPLSMEERPAVQAILAESDPRRLVRMWVRTVTDAASGSAPLNRVLQAARDVDPDAAELDELIRRQSLAGANAFADHLAGVGGLRPGLEPEHAADICWTLLNPGGYHRLVLDRGWSRSAYEDWLVTVVSASLLNPVAERAGAEPEIRVTHDRAASTYRATLDGEPAGEMTYEAGERLVLVTHTDVDERYAGLRVGSALVRFALDDLLAGERGVVVLCAFARAWVARHPGHARRLTELPPSTAGD